MNDHEIRIQALEDRRFELTEAQIDHIADKAAEKALKNVYAEVGKTVVKRFLWAVGLITVGLLMYLAGKDLLPR